MPKLSGRVLWGAVVALIAIQALLTVFLIHRESLVFDEGNHSFAGYMMWHTGDYGLNPEHPPLVKLLAALPTLGRQLWVPELKNRDFKTKPTSTAASGLRATMATAINLSFKCVWPRASWSRSFSLVVFLFARECFGDWAGLIALTLSRSIPTYSPSPRWSQPTSVFRSSSLPAPGASTATSSSPPGRAHRGEPCCRTVTATKHSGILFAPMMLLLIAFEVAAQKGTRARTALRLAGAFASSS